MTNYNSCAVLPPQPILLALRSLDDDSFLIRKVIQSEPSRPRRMMLPPSLEETRFASLQAVLCTPTNALLSICYVI